MGKGGTPLPRRRSRFNPCVFSSFRFSLDMVPGSWYKLPKQRENARLTRMEVAVVCVSATVGVRCFILAGVLALAACQTTDFGAAAGRAPDGAKPDAGTGERRVSQEFYTPFYDQGDHLKSFLRKGDLWGATRLVAEQEAFFSANREENRAELKEVANHLNEGRSPALAAQLAKIEAAAWPAPAEKWQAARSSVAAAEATLAAYPDHPILKDAEFQSDKAKALERATHGFKARMRDGAPREFAAFDPFGEKSFFDVYPVDLDAGAFVRANWNTIEGKLKGASPDQLKRFASLYPKAVIGEEAWQGLGGLFTAASLKTQDRGASPDLKAVLAAFSAAKQAGFVVKEIPGLKIGFIEVTSQTLLKHRQIEFPAGVEVDLPVAVEKAELDEALATPTAQAADYLIVFDVALAKASRRVTDTKKTPSRTVVGHQKEPNPAYEAARMKVMQAQNSYNTAQIQSSIQSTQPSNPYASPGAVLLGGLLQGIGNAMIVGSAKAKLDEAMQEMQATPQFIDKPIFEAYQFDKATVRGTKTMTVHYYIIDRRRGTYFKSTFDIVERRTFEAIYNVHQNDPAKDAHYASGQKEEDVAAWEEASATVRLSQLVDHYLAHGGQTKPLPELAVLRQEMLSDKNKALAKLEADRYDARPLNDPRFDNVVVVYVAAKQALGSGFFVAPDVVLTNWHVVEDKAFVEMKTYDKQETFGKVVAKDVRLDLALVKVQSRGRPVRFYSEKTLPLGATVEAIGHPKRLEFSITRGVVSAVRRHPSINLSGGGGKEVLYIQTDAPINPGNSGGPLFLGDRVVGVNTWGLKKDTAEGLNFAVHYSEVLEFLREHLAGFQAQIEK